MTGLSASSPASAGVTTDPGARTAWLSWLRVAAICGVVSIHTVGSNAAAPDARDTLRGQVALVLDFGAVFAVPVFVMASGAMLLDPRRYPGPGAFLRRRAGRLLPAMVFWHLWYAVLLIVVLDDPASPQELIGRALAGDLYTALYFFWIVFGLALLTPLLVPFVGEHGRRGTLVAGAIWCLIPVLTLATKGLRQSPVVFADSALTWWFPYVGLFLLGFGLRGVVVRRGLLVAAVATALAVAVLNAWQWRNPAAPGWLNTLTPVGYYSLSGIVFAVAVYLAAQSLVHPQGALRVLTRPRLARLGRTLGDATLGVYGLHLTVLLAVQRAGIGGEGRLSPSTTDLLLRLGLVLAVTWALVLLLRRVPLVRSVL